MNWRLEYEAFMPHGMCFLWRPELMALHVISDALIALAYFTIPFAILRFVRGREDLEAKHRRMALLFAAFIAFCGLTHVASIYVIWVPVYVTEGWLKVLTAVVSVATAIRLTLLVPQALKLPSNESMRAEIAAHRETMIALDAARAALAIRVDLTEGELRVAEQHQHQSNALLATVIEAMPGMIYAKDRSGRMLLANKATLEAIGLDWSQVHGRRDDEFLDDPRQAAIVMKNDRRVMDTGMTQELEEIVDFPKKSSRIFLSTKVPFAHADGVISGMVGVSIDITERKRLARELLHVSRRSAMGEMATAIAHEINQPLASVTLSIDGSLALLGADYDGPLTVPLTLARSQAVRAGEIIRRLRSFVSGSEDVRRPERLSVIVEEACGLALLGARENGVAVEFVHNEPDLEVLADSVQIEQVIVNLVRNALDAMGSARGGTLRIETGYDAEGMAILSVSDNGPGINADVVDRIFEAFVSTKGVKGMGIGLSICRTIIESHGGKLWADPKGAIGATFRFTLPAVGRVLP
ncbi:ATP-binding protein [Sphingomonas sp. RB3P16]|uniref:sensor histidine kinase n=1 Tax=Parasphingomonas frigoris TaxID=3096163 RepID=UPI002FC9C4C6